ncbi:hypothetical protein V8F33_007006, partial [Rhypophila sp. PSN 637]
SLVFIRPSVKRDTGKCWPIFRFGDGHQQPLALRCVVKWLERQSLFPSPSGTIRFLNQQLPSSAGERDHYPLNWLGRSCRGDRTVSVGRPRDTNPDRQPVPPFSRHSSSRIPLNLELWRFARSSLAHCPVYSTFPVSFAPTRTLRPLVGILHAHVYFITSCVNMANTFLQVYKAKVVQALDGERVLCKLRDTLRRELKTTKEILCQFAQHSDYQMVWTGWSGGGSASSTEICQTTPQRGEAMVSRGRGNTSRFLQAST